MSSSLRAGCADPVTIPADADQATQWRIWGADRRALADCKQRDAAKATALAALDQQMAR